MSDAISAQNTKLYVGFANDSPVTWTLIPEVKVIGGPKETSSEIKVTHLGSTGGREEYIQGFRDTDVCAVNMNYIPGSDTQADFLALYDTGEVLPMRILWPDGAYDIFNAFMKGRAKGAQVGNVLERDCELRITGGTAFTGS